MARRSASSPAAAVPCTRPRASATPADAAAGAAPALPFWPAQPATNDMFDGVDTTWGRVSGGAEIGTMAGDVFAHFDPAHPAASVPALLKIHHILAALPADPALDDKRLQLGHILQECLGLSVVTTIPQAEVVPGETLHLQPGATVHGDVPVRWIGIRYPSADSPNRPGDEFGAGSDRQPRLHQSAASLHADHPALLVARRWNNRALPRGRCFPHRPAGKSAGFSPATGLCR